MYGIKFIATLNFVGAVLVPFFTNWGGLTFSQIMILQSWFMFWILVLEIPTGTVADFWGRKISILLGLTVGAVGVLVYSSYPSFYVFLLGEFLWALSSALISGADDSLVYDSLKENGQESMSKKVLARLESFKLGGLVVGVLIGSLIAHYWGLRATMLAMIFSFSLSALVALFLVEPKVKDELETKRYFDILKSGVKFFANNKAVKILTLDMVAIASIAYFMIWLGQPLLMRAGVDIKYFGLVSAAMLLGEIGILNFYDRFEKLLGSKKRWLFGSAVVTGLFFILAAINYLPLVIIAIVITASFGLTRLPLFTSYINKYLPSAERATILSTVAMIRQLVLVVFNPLIGLLVDRSLAIALLILGVAAIGFSFFSKVEEGMLLD